MRKLTIFAASFGLVLIAGAALAEIGDLPRQEVRSSPTDAEAPEKPAAPVTEPTTTKATVAKPQVEDHPVEDQPKPEQPRPEEAKPDTPPDTTPPAFAILHPVDGQVFEQKEVAFEGEVEPGARVFAGEYEADVNEHGGWRIVLHLSPGENTATLKATDAAGNVTTDSVQVVFLVPKPDEEPKGEFTAHNTFGSCGEDPPYDVYYGTGVPGSGILVVSEYGLADGRVGDEGHWEIKVTFGEAPVGVPFLVTVKDQYGHSQKFEFVRTG